jgi:hypothetical protein
MKTARFLLPISVWAVLIHGMAHAAPFGQVSEKASAGVAAKTASSHGGTAAQSSPADSANRRDTDGQRDHRRAIGKDLARSRANLPKTWPPTTDPRNWVRSRSATALHLRQPGPSQPGPSRSSGSEGIGSFRDNTVNNAVPVRLPNIVRPASATVSNVHHRGSNLPIINGSVNSKIRQTGEISGNLMGRKR